MLVERLLKVLLIQSQSGDFAVGQNCRITLSLLESVRDGLFTYYCILANDGRAVVAHILLVAFKLVDTAISVHNNVHRVTSLTLVHH